MVIVASSTLQLQYSAAHAARVTLLPWYWPPGGDSRLYHQNYPSYRTVVSGHAPWRNELKPNGNITASVLASLPQFTPRQPPLVPLLPSQSPPLFHVSVDADADGQQPQPVAVAALSALCHDAKLSNCAVQEECSGRLLLAIVCVYFVAIFTDICQQRAPSAEEKSLCLTSSIWTWVSLAVLDVGNLLTFGWAGSAACGQWPPIIGIRWSVSQSFDPPAVTLAGIDLPDDLTRHAIHWHLYLRLVPFLSACFGA